VVLTDTEGVYSLNIPEQYADHKVVVTYSGYITESVYVEEGKFDFILREREAQTVASVYVSTQKRMQSSMEVPISITVLDSARLNDFCLEQINEVSMFSPGFQDMLQSVNNSVYGIRGVASDGVESYGQTRISVYMDGVSIMRMQGSVMELYDMERVEVVKGPQGTLFGRGSEFGAVHYIRKKPTRNFTMGAEASYGNFNSRTFTGFVNTPFSEKIANRFAFSYRAHDGYENNELGNDLNGKNTIALRNSTTFWNGNKSKLNVTLDMQHDDGEGVAFLSYDSYKGTDPIKLNGDNLFVLRDALGITSDFGYNFSDNLSLSSITGLRYLKSDETFDSDGTPYNVLNGEEWCRSVQVSEELRLSWDNKKRLTGFAGLSYFYEDSYHKYKFDGGLPYIFPLTIAPVMRESMTQLPDQLSAGVAQGIESMGANLKAQYPDYADVIGQIIGGLGTQVSSAIKEKMTEQLDTWYNVKRWGSTPDFYNDTKALVNGILVNAISQTMESDPMVAQLLGGASPEQIVEGFDIGSQLTMLQPLSGVELTDNYEENETDYNKTHEASIFADFTWNFLQKLYLTAGIRATYETIRAGYFSSSMAAPFVGSVIYTPSNGETVWASKNYSSWVGRLALHWIFNPTHNIYMSVSKGRRPGMVYFDYNPNVLVSLKPERTVSYEIGIKGSTKYGHLSYALAFYYYDWLHFQSSVNGSDSETGTLVYVNDDEGKAHGVGTEMSGLLVFTSNANLFVDIAYCSGVFSNKDMNGKAQQIAGNQFRLMPRGTMDMGGNIIHNLHNGSTLYFRPMFYYQSKLYFDNDNNETLSQHGFSIINANVGYRFESKRMSYDVGVYCKNIADTRYLIDAGNAGSFIGMPTFIPGSPRTFGIVFKTSFKK
jgi:outer membrane receptor protein involved in Fe transport